MNYGNILKKAWHSMWKTPILWVFALFAGQLTIRGLIQTLLPHNQEIILSETGLIPEFIANVNWNYNLDLKGVGFWAFIGLLGVLILIRTAVMFIGVIGLTRGILWQREDKSIQLEALIKDSLHFIGRYLAMSLLIFLGASLGTLPFFMFPLFFQSQSMIAILLVGGAFLLAVACYSFWIGQSINILLIKDCKIATALSESWNFIIRKHLSAYLIMLLIAVAIGLGIGLFIAIPHITTSIATMDLNFLTDSQFASPPLSPAMKVLSLILQLYTAIGTAVITVFFTGIWVHTYLDLKESEEKINLDEE